MDPTIIVGSMLCPWCVNEYPTIIVWAMPDTKNLNGVLRHTSTMFFNGFRSIRECRFQIRRVPLAKP